MAFPRIQAPLWLLLLALQVAALAWADGSTTQAPAAVDAAYIVQPGDTLQIMVWKEQDLQGEILVRPDGGLTFPLTGDIQAAGHTVEDIRKTVQSRLMKYIPDPVVTVVVKKTDGSRIFVVGKVNRPGVFLMRIDGETGGARADGVSRF